MPEQQGPKSYIVLDKSSLPGHAHAYQIDMVFQTNNVYHVESCIDVYIFIQDRKGKEEVLIRIVENVTGQFYFSQVQDSCKRCYSSRGRFRVLACRLRPLPACFLSSVTQPAGVEAALPWKSHCRRHVVLRHGCLFPCHAGYTGKEACGKCPQPARQYPKTPPTRITGPTFVTSIRKRAVMTQTRVNPSVYTKSTGLVFGGVS